MTRFEHVKLTLAGYKANNDDQRVEVFLLNPFLVKSFSTYNMMVTRLKSEIVS